jgi:hypothetical protein
VWGGGVSGRRQEAGAYNVCNKLRKQNHTTLPISRHNIKRPGLAVGTRAPAWMRVWGVVRGRRVGARGGRGSGTQVAINSKAARGGG